MLLISSIQSNDVTNCKFHLGKDLEHENEDCWSPCNEKQGPCSWCGSKGMCCTMRSGWKQSNGCDGTFGGSTPHVCALKPSKIHPSPIGLTSLHLCPYTLNTYAQIMLFYFRQRPKETE